MQLACLRIEHLPVKAEVHRNVQLQGQPVVLSWSYGSRPIVLDASPQAAGVSPGMPLAEALAECKRAVLVEPDLAHYRAVFEGVLTGIEALSAEVEEADLGLAYVRLDGLEPLFGGRERLTGALLTSVPACLAPTLGVGPNKFVAYVNACYPPLSPSGSPPQAGLCGEHPIGLLPLPWQAKVRLHGFGLRTLGQIAALPAGALQSQFGPAGKRMWELANGIDPRPFVPRIHEEVVEASLTFPSPTATLSAIVTAADSLLVRAFAKPAIQGRFARVCTLRGSVFRAPAWHKRMAFRDAIGDARRAAALVKHTLEGSPPPGPLEDLTVTLSGITGEAGRQESLFHDVRRQENLREALHQLKARLRLQPPIFHVQEMEPWSRLPERRQALVPYVP